MSAEDTYNGWINRSTWLVNLWIENEYEYYRHWNNITRGIYFAFDLYNPEEADLEGAIHHLAQTLERHIMWRKERPAGLSKDMETESWLSVNWREIAEVWLSNEY